MFEAEPPAPPRPASDPRADDARILGTLVHRLLARRVDVGLDEPARLAQARDLLTPAEQVELADADDTIRRAVDLHRLMRERPDVVELLEQGTCYYEVPFSYLPPESPGTCVRGTVDCVVVSPDGRIWVVEFKTGRPRPEHHAQAALYAQALKPLFGGPVTAKLCYP